MVQGLKPEHPYWEPTRLMGLSTDYSITPNNLQGFSCSKCQASQPSSSVPCSFWGQQLSTLWIALTILDMQAHTHIAAHAPTTCMLSAFTSPDAAQHITMPYLGSAPQSPSAAHAWSWQRLQEYHPTYPPPDTQHGAHKGPWGRRAV